MSTKSAILTAIADDTGSSNTDFVTNDSTLTFTGTATLGGSGTGKVEVHIDGINVGQATVDPIKLTWSVPVDLNAIGLSQGDHVITLWTANGVTNLAPGQTFGFTYDTIAPSATIDQIIDNDPADTAGYTGVVGYATPTNDHTPLLVGHADPFSTVQIYNWGLPVLVNGVAVTVHADAAGHWEYQFTTPLGDEVTDPISGGGDGGNYDFTAVAGTDLAGNIGTSANDYAITITADLNAVCYLKGTHIQTPRGEVAVEDLQIGDLVTTMSGQSQPVKWIGRRSYVTRFLDSVSRPGVLPIRIARGALDENVPHRDLFVSPEHCMCLDGVLIPARHLVNGQTIAYCGTFETIEYYHIELPKHGVLLAEGAAAESWLDCGNRNFFHNVMDYLAFGLPDEAPTSCLPLVTNGPVLEQVRTTILARATAMGYDLRMAA